MTLRRRITWSALALVLIGLTGVGLWIRSDTTDRLRAQYRARVDTLVDLSADRLLTQSTDLERRLERLRDALGGDDELRRALRDASPTRGLRDWAGEACALTGVDALQLQDAEGRILSSGHYRNDFDRIDLAALAAVPAGAERVHLVALSRPDGPFLALARRIDFTFEGRPLRLLGGFELDDEALRAFALDPEVDVALWAPDGRRVAGDPAPAGAVTRTLELPTGPDSAPARLVVSHSLAELRALIRSFDLRLLAGLGLIAAVAAALATWLAGSIARPLEALAARTQDVDLDRLDVRFPSSRQDEVGRLAEFLDAMTERLRGSVQRLRKTERRAATGDLARQVNHDLKNAFPPLRNVVRHLAEVSERPDELARVFRERRTTLDHGLTYLEELSANWQRLATRPTREPVDLVEVARQVANGRPEVTVDAAAGPWLVRADPFGLRRVLENVVENALEAGARRVAVRIAAAAESADAVTCRVTDDGPGIPAERLAAITEPHFTTKERGGGLGLSIVKRLVADYEGQLRFESPGRGTTVVVTFPRAHPGEMP